MSTTRITVALAAVAIALTSAAPAWGGPDVLRVARRALQISERADKATRAVGLEAVRAKLTRDTPPSRATVHRRRKP